MFRSSTTHQRNSASSSCSGNCSWTQSKRIGILLFGAAAVGGCWYLLKNDDAAAQEKKPVLDPNNFQKFALMSIKEVSPNTKIMRFALDTPDSKLGLPIASAIVVKAPIGEDGKDVIRPYTPITYDEKGYFDLMIKVYPTGVMSKYIGQLKVGSTLDIKGPIPKIPYTPNMKKTIGMVAGGTGITPMLQVIQEVLKNPQDHTEISLIFANVTAEDILLKDRLDAYATKHKNFKVYYTLDKPPAKWNQGTGFVTKDMISSRLPKPSKDTVIMVCGPPPMMNMISGSKAKDYTQGELSGVLKDLGYNESNVYKF